MSLHIIQNMMTQSISNKEHNENQKLIQDKNKEDDIDPYIETPWTIIESYFKGHYLERLVRHQLDSYNNFVNYQIEKTIGMFNPVNIKSEHDFDSASRKHSLELVVTFDNFHIYRPQIHENNGAIKLMFPQEARLRNFTYASAMTIDINIKFIIRTGANLENLQILHKTLPKIHIGKIPIMLKSSICVLSQYKHVNQESTGECKYDAGGYFIINGSEKTVLGQERAAENKVYCFNVSKNNTKYNWVAEIKSVPDFKCISPKQINLMVSSKNNGFGFPIYIQLPRVKQPVPLVIVFRALGIISDYEICEKILLNVKNEKYAEILEALKASIIDSNTVITQQDAIKYIVNYVMYTPINMDREAGMKKKLDFAIDILDNDLYPHCKEKIHKIYFLGYMTNRLIQVSLGWVKMDDRDSYLNKRIDMTGTLLNNLFRNYFNKLVKDMEKQIIKEINTGSWKSTNDYMNIVNMTNVYKIIKSTTIENGLKRALSTGDFGIKHINSNKVGVAQVLNRLTYVSSLSHLRRISTPIDKSGKLIPPRKLHGSSWGFLCGIESPEGASVGVVKNLSYMSHITIYSDSAPIYEFIMPLITDINTITANEMFDKVKVFMNGCWVGISENPEELYRLLKEKKYQGVINVYTSIIFDYNKAEIRICNDSGRITRPVLRVRNNQLILNKQVIKDLKNNNLTWDDLLTGCKLDDSVIEYIDPEEQSLSMISMKPSDMKIKSDNIYKYTHSEIHPNTMYGILASCIPFPEHNQSPRNVYQCLDANELVLMADGSKVKIGNVKVGDSVITFDPIMMELSSTIVIHQYVRKTDKKIYKIRTIDGREIVATEDHKFMTSYGWKEVKEIMNGLNFTRIGINIESEEELNHIRNNFKNFEIETKGNAMFIPVQDIRRVENRLISDITVQSDNHSFIAGQGFLSHNCAQVKQAMGVYVTNYASRMDKTAYVLNYPARPLVDTRIMEMIHVNEIPAGFTCIVAIMSYTGYNQEDSILFNKASVERGLFQATIFHTEKDEDKQKINGDEEIRCKPDPTKTKGMKFANYGKVNSKGLVPENTLIENRDVIIAKVTPIKENRNDHTKVIKYEDQSRIFKTNEETYIDKNYIDRNGDGYSFAKVRLRTTRKPVIGDKFCALPTQELLTNKGWVPICDIDINIHKCATQDANGNLLYEYPVAKFEYDHDGEMYSIKNKQVEIVCTLNHRLYIQRRSEKMDKPYELVEAQHVMGKIVRVQKAIPNAYPDVEFICIGGEEYKMDYWLEFLGMFIGDGSTNIAAVYLSCFKQRKIDHIKQFLHKLGVEYKYDECNGSFSVLASKYPEIYEEMDRLSIGALNKRLPDYVWNLSQRQSKLLLDSLMQSDGCTSTFKNGITPFDRYYTISLGLANDVSRLATHAGFSGNIKIKCEPTGIPHPATATMGNRKGQTFYITQKHTYYMISIITKQNQPWINKIKNGTTTTDEKLIHYAGKVYCVEMPTSHLYYSRESSFSPSIMMGNSSRAAQKCTLGLLIPEEDIPFMSNGVRPDLILNPHAIPSRMTIGHLKETLLSKILVELGLFGDGTSFCELDVKVICDELLKAGFESNGNEILYNGLTGEQHECSVFTGPIFYQRLKHMVADKQHSRSNGPMVNLTRQPAEGRSRDGGLRFGEMEKDTTVAHGAARFTKERLFDVSDKYHVYTCKKCGMIASYNDEIHIHKCRTCDNRTDFSYVALPYACKLMFQELQTMNVVPRIIT